MEKWSYQIPEKFLGADQSDWNATIITAFNCLALENNFSHKSKIETLVPIKFKNLIESLLFYADGIVANKYVIKFIEENSDIIILEGCQLEIVNYKN